MRSPLLHVAQACQACHRIPEEKIKARVVTIQDRNKALLTRGEEAARILAEAIDYARQGRLLVLAIKPAVTTASVP